MTDAREWLRQVSFRYADDHKHQMRDALLAVLDLHYPTTDSPGLKDYCAECGTYALWPCDTVRAINKALGVGDE